MIWNAPPCLVITLKRFSATGFGMRKNSKEIAFSIALSLDDYMIHRVHKDDTEQLQEYRNFKTNGKSWKSRVMYRLYGIVSHAGGMGGGHYVSFVCMQ